MPNKKHSNFTEMLDKAWDKYLTNDFKGSEAICKKMLVAFPDKLAINYLLAHINLEKLNFVEAMEHFTIALNKDVDRKAGGTINYWIGKLHERYSAENKNPFYDYKKAREFYLEAKKYEEYPIDVIYQIHFLYNEYERVKLYDEAIKKFPTAATLYLYKAQVYTNLNEPEKSNEILLEAHNGGLKSASFAYSIAKLFFNKKEFQKSIAFFNEALDLNKNHSAANYAIHYNLGNCYFELENFREAEIHYRKAFEETLDFNNCWFGFLGLWATYSKENRVDDLEKAINRLILTEDVFRYTDLVDGYPVNFDDIFTDRVALTQDLKQLLSTFKSLTFQDNNDFLTAKLFLIKALLLKEMRSTSTERLKSFSKALRIIPGTYEFLYEELSEIYSDLISNKIDRRQDVSAIVDTLKKDLYALPSKFKDSTVYVFEQLVEFFFKEKKYKELVDLKALYSEKHIDKVKLWFEVAFSLKKINDTQGAKYSYERVIKQGKSSAALNNLGVIYEEENNFARAIELYSDALKLNPNDEYPKRNLESTLKKQKEFEEKERKKKAFEKHQKSALTALRKENEFVLDKLSQFIHNVQKEPNFKDWVISIPKYKFPILMNTDKQKAETLRTQWLSKFYITELEEKDSHYVAFYSINPLLEGELTRIDNRKLPENWINGFNNLSVGSLEEIGYFNILLAINKINQKFKPLLTRDFNELVFNYLIRNEKATIVLSGSLIELTLIYYYEKKKILQIQYNDAKGNLKNKKLYDCELYDLIAYAETNRLFGSDFNYLGNLSRLYRNYIHPGRELKGKLDKSKCDLCFISTIEIIKRII